MVGDPMVVNPLRYVGEASPALVGLLVLCCVIVAINGWFRLRERRGDWGPGLTRVSDVGYAPVDLRPATLAPLPEDPHQRWLLGLAAPYVETEGLLHDRWSLVPAFCDDAWRRRLTLVARAWGMESARDWRAQVERIERQLDDIGPDCQDQEPRAWLTAHLAMLLRLGVAACFESGRRARHRLDRAAGSLRADFSDWLGYGNAIVAMDEVLSPGAHLRADVRRLYAADGPWHELGWPE